MSVRRHTVDPSISNPEGRFPSGVLTLVTEVPRIVDRLSSAASSAGLPFELSGDRLEVRVVDDAQDDACLTFGSFLSPLEQERVFLVRDGVGGPRVRSLRQVLAACQNSWIHELIRTGLFAAHLQPVVDLESGTVHGFEAFLRARARDGTQVSTERAFAAARATGSIPELDALARRAAFLASRLHLETSDRLLVKVDGASLADGIEGFELTLPVDGRLPQPPDRIVFEVAEEQAVCLDERALGTLDGLSRLGFLVALQNVSGGASTQALLESLRPDVAKLDRRLLKAAGGTSYAGTIVRAVADLARDLGVLLVAEGVETSEDVRFVREAGVSFAQGSFFAAPDPRPVRSFPALSALDDPAGPALQLPWAAAAEAGS